MINLSFILVFFSCLSSESYHAIKKTPVKVSLLVKKNIHTRNLKRLELKKKQRLKREAFKRKSLVRRVKNLKHKRTSVKKRKTSKSKSKSVKLKKSLKKGKKSVHKTVYKPKKIPKKTVSNSNKGIKHPKKSTSVKEKKEKKRLLSKKEEELLKKRLEMLKKERELREEVLKELAMLSKEKKKKKGSLGLKKAGSSGNKTLSLSPVYLNLVKAKLENNFAIPIYLKKYKDLRAVIKIKVDKEGFIKSYEFLQKSQYPEFNQAVISCLKISQPLPVNKKAVIIIEFKGLRIKSIK